MRQGRGRSSRRLRGARIARLGVGIGLLGSLMLPSAASAIDEFPVGVRPGGIAAGPDGALWFTEEGPPASPQQSFIGRLTTSGQYTHFPVLGPARLPDQIVAGPDGAMWFTQTGGTPGVGRIDMAGNIQEFACGCGSPSGITVGPDGHIWIGATSSFTIHRFNLTSGTFDLRYYVSGQLSELSDIERGLDGRLWFTESGGIGLAGNRIGALNPGIPPTITSQPAGDTADPAITRYAVSPGAEPSGIVSTAGGLLWFTEPGIGAIGRITTGGTVTEFPGAGSPSAIEAAADGALYYTLGFQGPPGVPNPPPCQGTGEHAIGRITTGGTFTNKFATPTPLSDPSDLTVGPDGALWFSEFCANKIGRIAVVVAAPPPPRPVTVSMTSLRVSPKSFRAAPKGGSISAKKKKKGKVGSRVSYTVSGAASTRFTVDRAERGRKSGKKCVKAKRGKKKGKRCTRYVRVKGSFTHKGKAGSNRFKFSGRVGSKKLKPASYRLNAVATAGPSKSKVRRANFKIIR
jgi:virginiamycin B lyase